MHVVPTYVQIAGYVVFATQFCASSSVVLSTVGRSVDEFLDKSPFQDYLLNLGRVAV